MGISAQLKYPRRLQSNFPDRAIHHNVTVAGGLVLAFVVRIWALLALQDSIFASSLLWDEAYYHDWAKDLLAPDLSSIPYHDYAPLPAYLMAFIYKVFGAETVFVRYANIILGTASCLLVYQISKELTGKNWALLALFCAALCKPLIFYSIVPLKTSLAVFLFGLLVFLILRHRQKPDWWMKIFLGVIFGLLYNVRPNVLILLPVLPFLLCSYSNNPWQYLKNITKTGFLFFTGIIFSISPFVVHNFKTNVPLRLTPLQSGFLLYATNNPSNPTPYYQPVSFASSHPNEQGIQFTIEASRRSGREMSAPEASSFWKKEVLKTIIENPYHWLKTIKNKTLSFFSFAEIDDHYHLGFLSSIVTFFAYPFIPYWFFFLFGMTGLIVGIIQIKQKQKTMTLAVIVFCYAATLIIYSTGTRFQLPLLVVFIPVTILTGKRLFLVLRKKEIGQISLYLLVLLLFTFSGLAGTGEKPPMAGHYNTYAFLLNNNGQEDEAIKWWEKSAHLSEPYSAYANLFLSGKYYQRYGMERAITILNSIPEQSFAAAAKHASMGDILLHHGYSKQAQKQYQKSLQINSGQRRVRKELIRIYRKNNDKRLTTEVGQLQYINSFYK